MTKNIKTIQSKEQLFNVCRIMKDNRIGSVIVVDESIPTSLCFLIVNFGKQIVSHIQIESFCSKI